MNLKRSNTILLNGCEKGELLSISIVSENIQIKAWRYYEINSHQESLVQHRQQRLTATDLDIPTVQLPEDKRTILAFLVYIVCANGNVSAV